MKKCFSFVLRIFVLSLLAVIAIMPAFAGSYGETISAEITVANKNGGVSIACSKKSNVEGYKIYRCENRGQAVKIADIKSSKSNTYIDKTAVSGTQYRYYVIPYSQGRQGVKSQTKVITYLDMPKIKDIKNGCNGIDIEWSSVKGAATYKVYRMKGLKRECIATLNSSQSKFTDVNVISGKRYTYTVIAIKGNFKSAYKYESSEKYLPSPKMKAVSNGDGFVSVSWSPVKGADSYSVYKKTNAKKWTLFKNVDGNTVSIKDTSVENGEKYVYTVEAVKGDAVSGRDEIGRECAYVSTPKNINLTNNADCISVKWDVVNKAREYRVYRKDGNDTSWKFIGNTGKPNYNDSQIEDGVSYSYTIEAVGVNGGVSSRASGVSLLALKSVPLKLYSMPDSVFVEWSTTSSATGYKIYRKLPDATKWTCIKTLKGKTSSQYEDVNVTNGKTYVYTVRQISGDVSGSYNTKGTSIKFMRAPVLTSMLSPKGVKLQWTKASQGKGYIVERYVAKSKTWSTVATINKATTLTYEHSGAEYGKNNLYRIRVKDANMLTNYTTIFAIDPKKPVVALTYDDGPHPTVTQDILDVLEKHNAKATFFVVGSRVNEYKDCIVREAKLGCEIGNHTYSHTILTSASRDTIVKTIESTNDVVEKLTGVRPIIVRPPGGSVNSKVRETVAYPLVNWSVDTMDWKSRNSSSVVSSIKKDVRDGSIVLMHDLYGSTAKATEIIVPWLISEGYQLVTVTQLMQIKGIYMEPGKLYFSAY